MNVSPPKNQPKPGRSVVPGRAEAGDQAAPEMRVAHEALVERHLAPLERQVEPAVRRLDAGHLLPERAVVRGRLPVELLGRGQQRRVGLPRRVELLDARRDDDRHEALRRHLRRDADRELRRRVRQVVRRLLGRRQPERRADERRVLAAALADDVRLERVVPVAVLPAERGRPHRLQVGPELHVDGQRLGRRHVEQHEAARLVERHEPRGVHGERRVRVPHRHGFRPDVHGRGEARVRRSGRRRPRRRTTAGSRAGS